MKKISSNINLRIWFFYSLLFAVLLIAIYSIMYSLDKSLIWLDGYTQHYLFLYDFNEIMREFLSNPQNGLSTFSFDMGLGGDIIGQYSYYVVCDPIAYLSLLFPMDKLELAYIILIFIRIYLVGISFMAFANYMKIKPANIVIGSLLYAFSGYVLFFGVRHPYFLNAVILFPLLLIGVEKLLKEGKAAFLTVIAFFSLVVNFYFFYMLTILTFIYALVKYIFEYRHRGLKQFFRTLLQAILGYLIAVATASAVLFPILYTVLQNSRLGTLATIFYKPPYYQHLLDGLVTTQGTNSSVYGISAIIILMIPLLLKNFRKHKAVLAYTLIILVILLVPYFSILMNGFSYPRNRWIFAFSMILVYIVTLFLDLDFKYSRKDKILMTVSLGIYLIAILIFSEKISMELLVVFTICIAMLLVIIFHKKIRKFVKPGIIMIALIVFNVYMMGYFIYGLNGSRQYSKQFSGYGVTEQKYSTMDKKITHYKEAIDLVQKDPSLFRIGKSPCGILNSSLYFNQMGVSSYMSLNSQYEEGISRDLENRECRTSRYISEFDNRTKINTLLGVKYYIADKRNEQFIPYGYSLTDTIKSKKEENDTQVYKNTHYLGITALYDSYLSERDYDKLSPLEKEDTLLNSAVLTEVPSSYHIPESKQNQHGIKSVKYDVIDPDKISNLEGNTVTTRKDGQSIDLDLETVKNSEIYLLIKDLKYAPDRDYGYIGYPHKKITIEAARDSFKKNEVVLNPQLSSYYIENDTILINLGQVKVYNGKVNVSFSEEGTYNFSDFDVLAVDMQKYKKDVDEMIAKNMHITQYGDNYIKGTTSNPKDSILQVATPYSKGWRAYVDGKETEVINVGTAFIGVPLKSGNHQVEFVYTSPYITQGGLISILGIGGFIALVIFERKRRNTVIS